ncbi:transposase [Streptomyces sp. NPDC047023]|uniref:transposase n=1 Tax=Streptomyces sp. NPDC047023 TaxID=3155139 RepID=UPI00340F6FF7
MDQASPRPPQESESEQLTEVLARCPELSAAHRLVRSFAAILSTRTGQHRKDWVVSARAEDLPGVHSSAISLEKDWDAVVQGLTSHWNSGPAEGRANHIIQWNQRCQAVCLCITSR